MAEIWLREQILGADSESESGKFALCVASWVPVSGGKFNVEFMGNVNNDRVAELKFSHRWQTNKIESDWSNSPRHSSSRQFRSPRLLNNRVAMATIKSQINKTFIFGCFIHRL